jgi:hypothetical protein
VGGEGDAAKTKKTGGLLASFHAAIARLAAPELGALQLRVPDRRQRYF